MTLLVTGCNDYVGSSVVKKFAEECELITMDLHLTRNHHDGLDYRSVHYPKRARLETVLLDLRSDHGQHLHTVIHLRSNTEGDHFLDAVNRFFEVDLFLIINLGRKEPLILDKKTINLQMAGIYDDDCHLPYLNKRISHIFEDRLRAHFYSEQSIPPFIHVDDLNTLLQELVHHRSELPQALDLFVSSGERLSEKEMISQLGQLIHHHAWPLIRLPHFFRSHQNDPLKAAESGKPSDYVHWVSRKKLFPALPKMVKALKNDPVRWFEEYDESGFYHGDEAA